VSIYRVLLVLYIYSLCIFVFLVAATTKWLGEMPNPIEIGGQVEACLALAKQAGLRQAVFLHTQSVTSF
jgi:hypothetical protein